MLFVFSIKTETCLNTNTIHDRDKDREDNFPFDNKCQMPVLKSLQLSTKKHSFI